MRRLILIFVFASLMALANSIIVYSQPVTWVRIIGDSIKSMDGISVVQTYDGGYVVLASKGAITSDSKMLLLKLDYLGNLQWLKYPADTIINISPIKLVQTNDSGFVILGLQTTNFLLKTDKNGNFLWRKNYPDTALAEARLYGFTKTNDNGFILCGNYTSFSPTLENGYLIKTDSVGNVKWQKGFHDSTSNNYFDIIQFPDNNYYVAGYTANSAATRYAITKKFKNNGDVIWTKLLLNPSGAGLLTRVQRDRIVVWSGLQSYGYNISLIDTSSNLIWQYSYFYPNELKSLNTISNGSILITGGVIQSNSIGINKLSITGDSIFTKTFLHPGYSNIGPRNTQNTNDNGFIITGHATVNNKSNILIIKTDSLFNSPMITNVSFNTETTPNSFELFQNYPNPFNPVSKINYSIAKQGLVTLKIYDILGREIKTLVNEVKTQGTYIVDFNGSNFASGVYFYKIQAGDFIQVKSMVLIK